MGNFTAEGGQFLLNGRPQWIQAGEFHYFRTPRDQWAHRFGLLKDAGCNTLATYIPWVWHQLDEGVTDLDGHTHPMRDLASFLDLAAEMDLNIIARPGPYIMAEMTYEGIPGWVFQKYPRAAYLSQAGKPQNVASYLQEDFLRCVRGWYREVFQVLAPRQVTRGGRILMIQLDNEEGMIQWVRNIFDVNPDTLERFAAYLRGVYGDHLPEGFPGEDLPGFLGHALVEAGHPAAERVTEEYRRFYRSYLREYTTWLLAEARANGLEVLPVINIHGFANGGKTFPIGLSQLAEVMRIPGMISASDMYPGFIGEGNFHQLVLVNEMTRALHNPAQPLFSIEFQAGGNQDFSGAQASFYELHTRLCLSNGMRAVNHYLFVDGENDPLLSATKRHDWGHPVRKDGTTRSHYPRYARLSRVIDAYGESLILAKPRTVTTIGFQLDDFMTEVSNPATRTAVDILTHQREVVLFDLLARGLCLLHTPFDALDLERGELDPARQPVLWMMMEKQCSPEVQGRLVNYVRSGGHLVIAGRICTEDRYHMPCTLLQDALGITAIRDDPPFTGSNIRCLGLEDLPVSFTESYSGAFSEVIAANAAGETVGFVQKLGAREALVFGAALGAYTLEDLDVVRRMARRIGCAPLLSADPWVDARISEGPTGNFLFLNNYQDDPVESQIALEGRPLLGGHPAMLPARRGLILPLQWQVRPGIRLEYATAEITGIREDGNALILTTEPAEFSAELSLEGYTCPSARPAGDPGHFILSGVDGVIRLEKES
jgi:beta-galactosidase